jgi:O-phosphoseryl-tRNA(Cys) synthetase
MQVSRSSEYASVERERRLRPTYFEAVSCAEVRQPTSVVEDEDSGQFGSETLALHDRCR